MCGLQREKKWKDKKKNNNNKKNVYFYLHAHTILRELFK